MNQHYFSVSPATEHLKRSVRLHLHDIDVMLTTDAGTFSPKRIDPGTQRLLEQPIDIPETGNLLDLGCGYGPIAIALAIRFPRQRIWAIDINKRALELVVQNAAQLHLTNVIAAEPGDVPSEVLFSAIVSNPPIKSGKSVLHEILLRWFERLTKNGCAYLVVQKNLGADSLMKWLNERGYYTRRMSSGGGYRVLIHKKDVDS